MMNGFVTPCSLRRRIASWLLALGVVTGTLAVSATPAQAATSIYACFQRPLSDLSDYRVRVDIWSYNQYAKTNTRVGYWFITVGNEGVQTYINENGRQGTPKLTCLTFPVPAAYQNTYTTLDVNYLYQNVLLFKGFWSTTWANPGAGMATFPMTLVMATNIASTDGLGVHANYWW